MGRKGRSSVFELFIHAASRLPAWVCLILAPASYLVLHPLADRTVQVATRPGSAIPTNMLEILLQPLFHVLQYAIPMVLVFGALVSIFKAFSGRRLAKQYLATPSRPSVDKWPSAPRSGTDTMNWQQFELLVGQAFRQAGYSVIDGGEEGPDGGVDVHLKKDGYRFFVQCKHWKTRSVGVAVVRELYGVMAAAGARGGFVVTSGDFTDDARAFASDKRIGLLNGVKLDKMLRSAAATLPQETPETSISTTPIPACPRCSSVMVKRKARQGANAGRAFWGCPRFPKCRGIINIDER
uniref:restriction endonuclease n=1 Tax=Marinobacterium profundum TaxID=1714300 RepID=UPI0008336D18|nr:restriction endonuclease [Marinobacterium profundum]